MWDKIKNILLYGKLDENQFRKVEPLTESENHTNLRFAAAIQAIYFIFSFVSSLGVAEMSDKRLVYAFGMIIPIAVLFLQFMFSGKNQRLTLWLVRIFSACLFVTGLLCTLVCTPDEMTILLLIFFFCVPMIFVVRPIEWVLLIAFTDIIYFAAAPVVKTGGVLSIDMIDVGIFSTLSLILGIYHIEERYRRYWLETEAVDLAQVRYQAAFIDQLTGVFNRNAYNKDTEALRTASLSPDFMFMTIDINGLKAANDTFGHVAGDELIVGAAECMKKSIADRGKVYRVGGDEFAVIMSTGGTSEGEILDTMNRTVNEWSGTLVRKLSISYGVVMGNEAIHMGFHEIELLADKRMYQSKSDYYKEAGIDRRRH